MYKIVVILIILFIILLLGHFFITREGFDTPTTTSTFIDNECKFEEELNDNNCNKIEDNDSGNEFTINNVCPNDPRCLGICINDHTWTDANKRDLLYSTNITGQLKNPKYKHLISSSRCGECVKNFYNIFKLINESKQCNI